MAKNVFGVRNDAEKIDGEAFVIRSVPAEIQEKIDALGQDAESFSDEYRPSRRIALLRSLALILGVILLVVAFTNASDAGLVAFGDIFRAYPVMLLVSFALWAFAIGTIFYERAQARKAGTSRTAEELRDRSDAVDAEAYGALGVPEDAVTLDLLTSTYRVKNGEDKNLLHTAFAFRAFVENGCLCLADVQNVVAIPLDAFGNFVRVERRVPFYFWNKPEPPRSETYRPYHIRMTYFGAYSVKGVRILHIHSVFGEYEILVPPYEIGSLLRLLGRETEGPAGENNEINGTTAENNQKEN